MTDNTNRSIWDIFDNSSTKSAPSNDGATESKEYSKQEDLQEAKTDATKTKENTTFKSAKPKQEKKELQHGDGVNLFSALAKLKSQFHRAEIKTEDESITQEQEKADHVAKRTPTAKVSANADFPVATTSQTGSTETSPRRINVGGQCIQEDALAPPTKEKFGNTCVEIESQSERMSPDNRSILCDRTGLRTLSSGSEGADRRVSNIFSRLSSRSCDVQTREQGDKTIEIELPDVLKCENSAITPSASGNTGKDSENIETGVKSCDSTPVKDSVDVKGGILDIISSKISSEPEVGKTLDVTSSVSKCDESSSVSGKGFGAKTIAFDRSKFANVMKLSCVKLKSVNPKTTETKVKCDTVDELECEISKVETDTDKDTSKCERIDSVSLVNTQGQNSHQDSKDSNQSFSNVVSKLGSTELRVNESKGPSVSVDAPTESVQENVQGMSVLKRTPRHRKKSLKYFNPDFVVSRKRTLSKNIRRNGQSLSKKGDSQSSVIPTDLQDSSCDKPSEESNQNQSTTVVDTGYTEKTEPKTDKLFMKSKRKRRLFVTGRRKRVLKVKKPTKTLQSSVNQKSHSIIDQDKPLDTVESDPFVCGDKKCVDSVPDKRQSKSSEAAMLHVEDVKRSPGGHRIGVFASLNDPLLFRSEHIESDCNIRQATDEVEPLLSKVSQADSPPRSECKGCDRQVSISQSNSVCVDATTGQVCIDQSKSTSAKTDNNQITVPSSHRNPSNAMPGESPNRQITQDRPNYALLSSSGVASLLSPSKLKLPPSLVFSDLNLRRSESLQDNAAKYKHNVNQPFSLSPIIAASITRSNSVIAGNSSKPEMSPSRICLFPSGRFPDGISSLPTSPVSSVTSPKTPASNLLTSSRVSPISFPAKDTFRSERAGTPRVRYAKAKRRSESAADPLVEEVLSTLSQSLVINEPVSPSPSSTIQPDISSQNISGDSLDHSVGKPVSSSNLNTSNEGLTLLKSSASKIRIVDRSPCPKPIGDQKPAQIDLKIGRSDIGKMRSKSRDDTSKIPPTEKEDSSECMYPGSIISTSSDPIKISNSETLALGCEVKTLPTAESLRLADRTVKGSDSDREPSVSIANVEPSQGESVKSTVQRTREMEDNSSSLQQVNADSKPENSENVSVHAGNELISDSSLEDVETNSAPTRTNGEQNSVPTNAGLENNEQNISLQTSVSKQRCSPRVSESAQNTSPSSLEQDKESHKSPNAIQKLRQETIMDTKDSSSKEQTESCNRDICLDIVKTEPVAEIVETPEKCLKTPISTKKTKSPSNRKLGVSHAKERKSPAQVCTSSETVVTSSPRRSRRNVEHKYIAKRGEMAKDIIYELLDDDKGIEEIFEWLHTVDRRSHRAQSTLSWDETPEKSHSVREGRKHTATTPEKIHISPEKLGESTTEARRKKAPMRRMGLAGSGKSPMDTARRNSAPGYMEEVDLTSNTGMESMSVVSCAKSTQDLSSNQSINEQQSTSSEPKLTDEQAPQKPPKDLPAFMPTTTENLDIIRESTHPYLSEVAMSYKRSHCKTGKGKERQAYEAVFEKVPVDIKATNLMPRYKVPEHTDIRLSELSDHQDWKDHLFQHRKSRLRFPVKIIPTQKKKFTNHRFDIDKKYIYIEDPLSLKFQEKVAPKNEDKLSESEHVIDLDSSPNGSNKQDLTVSNTSPVDSNNQTASLMHSTSVGSNNQAPSIPSSSPVDLSSQASSGVNTSQVSSHNKDSSSKNSGTVGSNQQTQQRSMNTSKVRTQNQTPSVSQNQDISVVTIDSSDSESESSVLAEKAKRLPTLFSMLNSNTRDNSEAPSSSQCRAGFYSHTPPRHSLRINPVSSPWTSCDVEYEVSWTASPVSNVSGPSQSANTANMTGVSDHCTSCDQAPDNVDASVEPIVISPDEAASTSQEAYEPVLSGLNQIAPIFVQPIESSQPIRVVSSACSMGNSSLAPIVIQPLNTGMGMASTTTVVSSLTILPLFSVPPNIFAASNVGIMTNTATSAKQQSSASKTNAARRNSTAPTLVKPRKDLSGVIDFSNMLRQNEKQLPNSQVEQLEKVSTVDRSTQPVLKLGDERCKSSKKVQAILAKVAKIRQVLWQKSVMNNNTKISGKATLVNKNFRNNGLHYLNSVPTKTIEFGPDSTNSPQVIERDGMLLRAPSVNVLRMGSEPRIDDGPDILESEKTLRRILCDALAINAGVTDLLLTEEEIETLSNSTDNLYQDYADLFYTTDSNVNQPRTILGGNTLNGSEPENVEVFPEHPGSCLHEIPLEMTSPLQDGAEQGSGRSPASKSPCTRSSGTSTVSPNKRPGSRSPAKSAGASGMSSTHQQHSSQSNTQKMSPLNTANTSNGGNQPVRQSKFKHPQKKPDLSVSNNNNNEKKSNKNSPPKKGGKKTGGQKDDDNDKHANGGYKGNQVNGISTRNPSNSPAKSPSKSPALRSNSPLKQSPKRSPPRRASPAKKVVRNKTSRLLKELQSSAGFVADKQRRNESLLKDVRELNREERHLQRALMEIAQKEQEGQVPPTPLESDWTSQEEEAESRATKRKLQQSKQKRANALKKKAVNRSIKVSGLKQEPMESAAEPFKSADAPLKSAVALMKGVHDATSRPALSPVSYQNDLDDSPIPCSSSKKQKRSKIGSQRYRSSNAKKANRRPLLLGTERPEGEDMFNSCTDVEEGTTTEFVGVATEAKKCSALISTVERLQAQLQAPPPKLDIVTSKKPATLTNSGSGKVMKPTVLVPVSTARRLLFASCFDEQKVLEPLPATGSTLTDDVSEEWHDVRVTSKGQRSARKRKSGGAREANNSLFSGGGGPGVKQPRWPEDIRLDTPSPSGLYRDEDTLSVCSLGGSSSAVFSVDAGVHIPVPTAVRKVHVVRETGESVLHKAARQGLVDVVQWCCETGYARASGKDHAGFAPLHESCATGQREITRLLLAYGADVNVASTKDGIRPLHDSVQSDDIETVRLLLSCGADPALRNFKGLSIKEMVHSAEMRQFLNDCFSEHNSHDVTEPWQFAGYPLEGQDWDSDDCDIGKDVLADVPSETDAEETEDSIGRHEESGMRFECSEQPLFPTYSLVMPSCSQQRCEYVLLLDLLQVLGMSKHEFTAQMKLYVHQISWYDFARSVGPSGARCKWMPADPRKQQFAVDLVRWESRLRDLLGVEVVYVTGSQGVTSPSGSSQHEGGLRARERGWSEESVTSDSPVLLSDDEEFTLESVSAPLVKPSASSKKKSPKRSSTKKATTDCNKKSVKKKSPVKRGLKDTKADTTDSSPPKMRRKTLQKKKNSTSLRRKTFPVIDPTATNGNCALDDSIENESETINVDSPSEVRLKCMNPAVRLLSLNWNNSSAKCLEEMGIESAVPSPLSVMSEGTQGGSEKCGASTGEDRVLDVLDIGCRNSTPIAGKEKPVDSRGTSGRQSSLDISIAESKSSASPALDLRTEPNVMSSLITSTKSLSTSHHDNTKQYTNHQPGSKNHSAIRDMETMLRTMHYNIGRPKTPGTMSERLGQVIYQVLAENKGSKSQINETSKGSVDAKLNSAESLHVKIEEGKLSTALDWTSIHSHCRQGLNDSRDQPERVPNAIKVPNDVTKYPDFRPPPSTHRVASTGKSSASIQNHQSPIVSTQRPSSIPSAYSQHPTFPGSFHHHGAAYFAELSRLFASVPPRAHSPLPTGLPGFNTGIAPPPVGSYGSPLSLGYPPIPTRLVPTHTSMLHAGTQPRAVDDPHIPNVSTYSSFPFASSSYSTVPPNLSNSVHPAFSPAHLSSMMQSLNEHAHRIHTNHFLPRSAVNAPFSAIPPPPPGVSHRSLAMRADSGDCPLSFPVRPLSAPAHQAGNSYDRASLDRHGTFSPYKVENVQRNVLGTGPSSSERHDIRNSSRSSPYKTNTAHRNVGGTDLAHERHGIEMTSKFTPSKEGIQLDNVAGVELSLHRHGSGTNHDRNFFPSVYSSYGSREHTTGSMPSNSTHPNSPSVTKMSYKAENTTEQRFSQLMGAGDAGFSHSALDLRTDTRGRVVGAGLSLPAQSRYLVPTGDSVLDLSMQTGSGK